MPVNRRKFIQNAAITGAAIAVTPLIRAAGFENFHEPFSINAAPENMTFGDRQLKMNCSYPSDVFYHNGKGGRLIDVTKSPFNAKADGKADDTNALIKAYDFVLAEMDKYEWDGSGSKSPLEYIIYLRKGTYLISDTIIYSGAWRSYESRTQANAMQPGKKLFEKLVRIRFFGQSREETIIKLKSNCSGYDNTSKAVVSFGKSDLNNAVAFNSFRNITINTGKGNPSAVGLDFCGANNTGIHNVSVISEDGKGIAGIDFRISPSMGYHKDITITGFDYAIRMTPYHMTHNCFEYLTIKNQNKAGIQLNECSTCIRKWHSVNRVPAIEITTDAAQAIIIDSKLEGSDKSVAAINAKQGTVFIRNTITSGYKNSILVKNKAVVSEMNISEYVSGPVLSLRDGQVKKSLNLPIEELPVTTWNQDFKNWANVDSFGAKGDGITDDSAAVQAAFNSGKPVVYFTKAVYKLSSPVTVPKSTEHVIGFYGWINGQLIIKEGDSPLFIEDFGQYSETIIKHDNPRTLVLNHVHTSYSSGHNSNDAKVFINNCNNLGKNARTFTRGRFWVRFMDTEYKIAPNFTCKGADMWVFGYKVEGRMTNFEVLNGGRLEVLGGMCNEHGKDFSKEIPVVRNVESSLCYVGLTNGPNKFEVIVEETLQGKTKKLLDTDCPRRGKDPKGWDNDVIIPMYVSYKS